MTAAVILSFILLFSMLVWNSLAMRWNSSSDYREMQTDALFAAEALMTTPGTPKSWEMLPQMNGSITTIGLVNSRNELNRLKIEKMVSENDTAYGLVKNRLGLQRYELGINITSLDKRAAYYEFGAFPGGLENAVVFERMGILNETPVMVRIEVWK